MTDTQDNASASPQAAKNSLPHHALIKKVQALWDEIGTFGNQWVENSLKSADPNSADLDDYAKPLITLAELLRYQGMRDTSRFIYQRAIEIADRYCTKNAVDLHRGAIYANYAIAQFEVGKYAQGLSWLHAAAQEDIHHRSDVKCIFDSYAFSDTGIFGQWLNAQVIKKLPPDAIAYVSAQLGTNISEADVRAFIRWLAGKGDLSLISAVVEYADLGGMTDYHAQAVRLTCIRDLATLFEALLKMLGDAHKDAAVTAAFANPPTLAGLLCHMHYQDSLRTRRQNPALNANKSPGLFHNSMTGWPALLDAIDSGIDFCAGRANNCDQVWQYLNSNTLNGNDQVADAAAKRFLLAYKLRNQTSHTLHPTDPAIAPHYDEFHLWLLQAVLLAYFWAKQTGDMNL